MGTTAWKFEHGTWRDTTAEWRSDDEWGWREELRENGYEPDPAVRVGDIDTDALAAEAFPRADGSKGYAVVVTVGDGGEVVLVSGLPALLEVLGRLTPVVQGVSELNLGATSAMEREYARLRRLGYPHEVADEASRTFAEELEDDDEDEG